MRIAEIIQQQLEANIRHNMQQTYKMSISVKECEKLLEIAYKGIVAKKGKMFLADEALMQNLTRIASWSCKENKNPFLFIAGTVGNGKTSIAKACVQVINAYWGARMEMEMLWRTPFVCLTATELNEIAKSDAKYYNTLKNRLRMMIDDIGTEAVMVKNYGNEISPFTEMLYHRYDRGLQTILTSNLTLEQIKERYGVRVFDRIQEANKIFFTSKSYRL